jgi:hypothetical protein
VKILFLDFDGVLNSKQAEGGAA